MKPLNVAPHLKTVHFGGLSLSFMSFPEEYNQFALQEHYEPVALISLVQLFQL